MGERRKCAGEHGLQVGRGLFARCAFSYPTAEAKAPKFLIEGLQKGNGPRGIDLLPGIQAKIQLHLVTLRRDTQQQWQRPSCGGDPADGAPGSGRREPKYGAPAGLTENRFRPETPATPSAGALFFNRGPNLLDPLPNSVFVPLDGFAPVSAGSNSWCATADQCDPRDSAHRSCAGCARRSADRSTNRCRIRRLRTSQQLLLQLLALLRRQFRRSSAGWNGSESSFASAALGTLPTADAARVNLDAGDFSLRQALLEQIDGALTFALQLFRTALRSDRSPPHHQSSIGHY